MKVVGKTINEQGVMIAVTECPVCSHHTTGNECDNCYLREVWDESCLDERGET